MEIQQYYNTGDTLHIVTEGCHGYQCVMFGLVSPQRKAEIITKNIVLLISRPGVVTQVMNIQKEVRLKMSLGGMFHFSLFLRCQEIAPFFFFFKVQ